MASDSDKKIVLLYVLDILRDYSDSQHLLTYSDILAKLYNNYGIEPNVKSVARNIDTLSDYGYNIVKRGKLGCYLATRDFDQNELMFMVDAIFSSKIISSEKAKELIIKLTKNCSRIEKKKYKHIYKVSEINRVKQSILFENIDILDKAIEQGKKISFKYNEYDVTKNFAPRKDGKEYLINPYYLVNNLGKYYLVCNYDKYNDLSNYKIECISDIKILEEDVKPIEKLNGCENFNLQQYINEHIYMTFGDTITAQIRLEDPKAISYVEDWYGDNARYYIANEKIYADLKVNEQALIYWTLQYGEMVEILKPESTRQKYKKILNKICKKYEN